MLGGFQTAFIPIPKPCFLDTQDYLHHKNGQKLWRSPDKDRYFTWDGLHGEIEVFNARGHHLGSIDAVHGRKLKDAVPGRTIDVN